MEDLRKRHFQEFIIMADECDNKGWDLKKFIRYMLLILDEDKLKEVLKQA